MIAAGPSQSRWVCDAKSSRLNAAQHKIWLNKTVRSAAAQQWEARQRDSEKRGSAAVRSATARQWEARQRSSEKRSSATDSKLASHEHHSEFLHLEDFWKKKSQLNIKEKLLKTSVENSKEPLKSLSNLHCFLTEPK